MTNLFLGEYPIDIPDFFYSIYCFYYLSHESNQITLISNKNCNFCRLESLFMLIMYSVYCVALSFNAKLERWAKSYNIPFLPKDDEPAEESALVSYRSLQEDRLSYTGPNSPVTEQVKNQEGNLLSCSVFFVFFANF